MFEKWAGWDSKDVKKYEEMVKRAKKLKFVGVSCGGLSEVTRSQMEDPTNPFTRFYTAPSSSIFKFVEAGALSGIYEPEHIAKNAALLRKKSRILKKHNMRATFNCMEPQLLLESFYKQHPKLRGPRVDHPGRSKHPYYAPCIDRKEILAAYREGVRKLLELCPEIKRIVFLTNDSGSGLCWCENLYPGRNGPAGCKNVPFGLRMKRWFGAMQAGAKDAGIKDLEVLMNTHTSFTVPETKATVKNFPRNCGFYTGTRLRFHLRSVLKVAAAEAGPERLRGGKRRMPLGAGFGLGTFFGPATPPTPFIFLEMLAEMEHTGLSSVGYSTMAAAKGLPDISLEIFKLLKNSIPETEAGQMQLITRALSRAGIKKRAEEIITAWREIENSICFWPRIWIFHWYSTVMRLKWDVRPLVAMPERLSAAEEKHYKKDVFCAAGEKERLDFLWEAGHRIINAWGDAALVQTHLVMGIKRVDHAIEILNGALKGTSGIERRYIVDQILRARYIKAFYTLQMNVATVQPLIDKYTTQYKRAYDKTKAMDYGKFMEAVESEIENCKEFIALAKERPGFFPYENPVRALKAKIAAMKRHLPKADKLFEGWKKYGGEKDFVLGVKPKGW